MAEQDQVFYKAWTDFQKENPRFQDYRLERDDGAGRDPAWLKLQANHPRFLMHRPVSIFEPPFAEIEDTVGKNMIAHVAAGVASDVAFHQFQAGKKSGISSLGNVHQAMVRALRVAAAVALVLAAALAITFYIAGTLSLSVARTDKPTRIAQNTTSIANRNAQTTNYIQKSLIAFGNAPPKTKKTRPAQ